MSPTGTRRGAPLLAVLASFAAFVAAAAVLDPGLRPGPGRAPLAPEDEAGVLGALVDFQRIYQDFFATGGAPALLDEFPASKEVKHQLFRDIGFVRDAGLVLVQDLATATLVEVERTGADRAEAITYEEWNWVFQRSADRVPSSEVKGLGQGFRYRLRKDRGRWIVTGWGPEDIPAPPAKEGRKW